MSEAGPLLWEVPRLFEKFWAQVDPSGDCWDWTGFKTSEGYGRLHWGDNSTFVHRLVWELMVGPIPPGLEIDHRCFNEGCVNPDHLEPVTRRENLLRRRGSKSRAFQFTLRTHCPRLHPYDEINTHWTRKGHRQCKACWQVYRDKRKAAAA